MCPNFTLTALGWGTETDLISGQLPENVDFADIVDQSEQPPLYIHLRFGAYRESIHAFMHTYVCKDRLDNAEPPGIDFLALLGVYLGFHLINQVWLCIHWNGEIPESHRGLAQTARPQRTGGAVFGSSHKVSDTSCFMFRL